MLSNARGAVSQVKTSVQASIPVTSATQVLKNFEAALSSVMDNLENMVEKYLPKEEKKKNVDGEDVEGGSPVDEEEDQAALDADGVATATGPHASEQVRRALHLSLHVQREITRKIVTQIKHLQATLPDVGTELNKFYVSRETGMYLHAICPPDEH